MKHTIHKWGVRRLVQIPNFYHIFLCGLPLTYMHICNELVILNLQPVDMQVKKWKWKNNNIKN